MGVLHEAAPTRGCDKAFPPTGQREFLNDKPDKRPGKKFFSKFPEPISPRSSLGWV
jgi:hypothetical protein